MDGFDVDVSDSEGYYKAFYDSINQLYEDTLKTDSFVYEVGCGSGANLYLLQNRGIRVGGIDYSENLCKIAATILSTSVITHDEAIKLDEEEQCDAVISDSVFAYFKDETYAEVVLEKMLKKARKHVVILEVFDKDLESECMNYRRSQIKNYDLIYKGLDKVFYSRDFFKAIATKNNFSVQFTEVVNKYYWNSRFMFNVVMTKNA